MSNIDRKLAEKCAEFGLPPSFDTLMRHIENNHAATVGAQRSHIESLERQLAVAVEALREAKVTLRDIAAGRDPAEQMQQMARDVLDIIGGQ